MKKLLFILFLVFVLPVHAQYSGVKPILGEQINWSHPLSTGLVGCWLMNEGGGSTIGDLSNTFGYKTLSGITWTVGGSGSALTFSGSSASVDLFTSTTLPVNLDSFSIVARINLNVDPANYGCIFGAYYKYGIWFAYNGSESLCLYHLSQGNTYDIFVSAGRTVPLYEWHTVAGTYDQVTKILYLDGVQNDVDSAHGKPGPIDWSSGTYSLGSGPNDGYNTAHLLDYAFIYNRALSALEIQQLHYDPFCIFVDETPEMYVTAAAPAGTGQVIIVIMSGLPLLLIIGIAFGFMYRGRVNV